MTVPAKVAFQLNRNKRLAHGAGAILVVDDDRYFARFVARFFEERWPVSLAYDLVTARARIRETGQIRLAMMDLVLRSAVGSMRNHDVPEGFSLINELRERHPFTKLVVLTAHAEPGLINWVQMRGGEYLVKDDRAGGPSVVDCLRSLERRLCEPPLERAVRIRSQESFLTPRQHEALTLAIVQGYSYREIAAAMRVSRGTVNQHMNRALRALGATSVGDLRAELLGELA